MKRILIATDDSPCSFQAVRRYASTLEGDVGALVVLSVIAPPDRRPDAPLAPMDANRAAEEAQHALDVAIADLAKAGLDATGVVRGGDPAATILAVARELDVDAIVMGTRGPRDDSVATTVKREARCDVQVFAVPPEAAAS